MKLGVDISPLQGPHRMRGVGSVIFNFLNHIDAKTAKDLHLVLYMYPEDDGPDSALRLLRLDNVTHEIRHISDPEKPARFSKPRKALRELRSYTFGDPRTYEIHDLDAFIQPDQMVPLPRAARRVRRILIGYDLIPYVLEASYLRGYASSRESGHGRKASVKNQLRRWQYRAKISSNCRRADKVLAISECTKRDFVALLGAKAEKITVTPLGAPDVAKADEHMEFRPYRDTSWGAYRGKTVSLRDKKYILYIGGVDPRRKVIDLLAAYNNLRAQGEDTTLVLAGDVLTTLQNIPDHETREYGIRHTYTDDLLLLGFVGEDEKSWLYENALAVVYPSVYEGFGLPVLEAMKYGTPVITYKNSSIPEVGGKAALYADNHLDIVTHLKNLMDDQEVRLQVSEAGARQASKFSWKKTAKHFVDESLTD